MPPGSGCEVTLTKHSTTIEWPGHGYVSWLLAKRLTCLTGRSPAGGGCVAVAGRALCVAHVYFLQACFSLFHGIFISPRGRHIFINFAFRCRHSCACTSLSPSSSGVRAPRLLLLRAPPLPAACLARCASQPSIPAVDIWLVTGACQLALSPTWAVSRTARRRGRPPQVLAPVLLFSGEGVYGGLRNPASRRTLRSTLCARAQVPGADAAWHGQAELFCRFPASPRHRCARATLPPLLGVLVVGGGRACPAATAGHVHRAGVHAAHRSQVCVFLLVHAIVAGAMSFDLDESQQEAWELYLEKKNVCLFGRAGCGKSTLILRAIAHAQRTHGTNRVVVLAWTNFAANLVGGKTLHKFLRVGIADVPKDVILEKVRCNAFARESVKAAKVIFIDELPQFPARWFAVLEFVVRQLALDSHQGRPWGGIQVVGTFRREAVYSSCVGEALLDRWYEDCP